MKNVLLTVLAVVATAASARAQTQWRFDVRAEPPAQRQQAWVFDDVRPAPAPYAPVVPVYPTQPQWDSPCGPGGCLNVQPTWQSPCGPGGCPPQVSEAGGQLTQFTQYSPQTPQVVAAYQGGACDGPACQVGSVSVYRSAPVATVSYSGPGCATPTYTAPRYSSAAPVAPAQTPATARQATVYVTVNTAPARQAAPAPVATPAPAATTVRTVTVPVLRQQAQPQQRAQQPLLQAALGARQGQQTQAARQPTFTASERQQLAAQGAELKQSYRELVASLPAAFPAVFQGQRQAPMYNAPRYSAPVYNVPRYAAPMYNATYGGSCSTCGR